MSAALFQLNTEHSPKKRWWTNQELAEFYRVSDIMAQAGLEVDSESGLSDEGDPWFVYVRSDTGDVIAHFAIIDGTFIAVSAVTQDLYRGKDIRSLIDQLVERHPMMMPSGSNGKVVLHPSILLTAFVAAAFVAASEEVQANTIEEVLEVALAINNGEKNTSIKTGSNTTNPSQSADVADEETSKEINAETAPAFNDLDAGKTFGSSFSLLGAIILALEISSRETALANTQQSSSSLNVQVLIDLYASEYLPVPSLVSVSNLFSIIDFNQDDVSNLGNSTQFQEPIPNSQLTTKKSAVTLTTDVDGSYLGMQGSKLVTSESLINSHNTQNNSTDDFSSYSHLGDGGFSQETTADSDLFYSSDTQQANKTVRNDISEQKLSVAAIDIVSLVSGTVNSASQKEDSLNHYSLDNSLITSFSSGPVDFDMQIASVKEVQESPTSKENSTESEVLAPSLNIKGHLLSAESPESLTLSNEVDILLYEGGNVSVSNFELGKDRVWFFLSEGKNLYESYKITESNDLVLEFETGDTLTLLGVLDTETSSVVL